MNNNILIKSYDKSAEIYDQNFRNLQYVKFRTMLEQENLIYGQKIIDLGCGTGLLHDYMKKEATIKGPEYFGIDFSPEMVKAARAKKIENIMTGNITKLPWPDCYFDAAFSFTVIGLGSDPPERIFSETCRVLVPGGKFIMTVLEKHHTKILENLLAQSGFDIVELTSGCGQDFGIKAVKNCK